MIRDNSLCGSRITVSINGQRGSATIGGLILIQTDQGYFQTLGIIAGHFLTQEYNMEDEDAEDAEDVDDDLDEESFDDGQEFELESEYIGARRANKFHTVESSA